MRQGYIKLFRRLKDSDIWLKEKFTRGQAWVDLLMLANHKSGFIRKRGIRVDLNRGDIGWSERELAKRWKWSRDRVRRFLNELCSENESKLRPQTRPQNKHITSCYQIINYNKYQGNQPQYQPQTRPQTGHKQDQNKNEKNEKNEREGKALPLPENFKLKKEHLEYASKNRPDLDANDLEYAFNRFCNHYRAKGTEYEDWDSMLCNWILSQRKAEPKSATPQGESQPLSTRERIRKQNEQDTGNQINDNDLPAEERLEKLRQLKTDLKKGSKKKLPIDEKVLEISLADIPLPKFRSVGDMVPQKLSQNEIEEKAQRLRSELKKVHPGEFENSK